MVYHPRDTREYRELAAACLPGACLVGCATEEEIAALMPEVEIIFGWRIPVGCFSLARRLKWFQGMGAGVEDLVENLPPGTLLTRVVGIFGPWIAEYVVAHVLAWTQDLRRAYASQTARRWDRYQVRKARDLRLGVAGLGYVGSEVARLGRALGMQVSGFDLTPRPMPDGTVSRCGEGRGPALHGFLSEIDVLSVNLPLTPQTERLFGADEFAALPKGAFVVNTSRGKILDETALVEALRSGWLGGAALDVFEEEPLPAQSPLWTMPNVTVTAHLSGPSTPAEVVPLFVENYRRYQAGEPLVGLVDRARGF